MLRSYEHSDIQYSSIQLQEARLFEQEKQIARRFVESHSCHDRIECCPVCGDVHVSPFFVKWGVLYDQCERCLSVFCSCSEDILHAYQSDEQMLEIRCGDDYQKDASKRRNETWLSFLQWLAFRTFRYLGRNIDLDMIDIGNRYIGFSQMLRDAKICGRYELRDSILGSCGESLESADVVLYLNQLQQVQRPAEKLGALRRLVRDDGLLILNTRAGSGYDIMALKDRNEKVYPYEHILLPSIEGLTVMLNRNGFQVLEITTPGVMDMNYILASRNDIPKDDYFCRYLANKASQAALQEFQRYLQKYGLSSFVQVIARKI